MRGIAVKCCFAPSGIARRPPPPPPLGARREELPLGPRVKRPSEFSAPRMSGRFAVTPWQLQLVSSVDIPLAGCIELTQEHGLGRNELGLTSSVISRKAHVMFYCDASRYVRVGTARANARKL